MITTTFDSDEIPVQVDENTTHYIRCEGTVDWDIVDPLEYSQGNYECELNKIYITAMDVLDEYDVIQFRWQAPDVRSSTITSYLEYAAAYLERHIEPDIEQIEEAMTQNEMSHYPEQDLLGDPDE